MILVRYHSQEHGNTKLMAKAAAEGAREAGADVTLVNTNTVRLDPGEHRRFYAVALGTPQWARTQKVRRRVTRKNSLLLMLGMRQTGAYPA
jgi:flavodoxin